MDSSRGLLCDEVNQDMLARSRVFTPNYHKQSHGLSESMGALGREIGDMRITCPSPSGCALSPMVGESAARFIFQCLDDHQIMWNHVFRAGVSMWVI